MEIEWKRIGNGMENYEEICRLKVEWKQSGNGIKRKRERAMILANVFENGMEWKRNGNEILGS